MAASNNKPDKKQMAALRISRERQFLLSGKTNFFLKEAYKTLRSNLTFALADVDGSRVVIITSSLQSEGKSITAANIALSIAQADQKVLLVDCDLRRPKQNKLLKVKVDYGLSEVLANPALRDQAICAYAPNMDLLLAGKIPPNPLELLASNHMSALLDWAREKYDYILLDTPPVGMVSDATVLSAKADGVLMVVRMGMTDRNALASTMEQLNYAKAKVLGFVLNGTGSYASYSRYGYRRRYGYRYGNKHGYRYGYKYGYGHSGYGYGYGYQQHSSETEKSSQKDGSGEKK